MASSHPPWHPAVVHFPIAAWVTATVIDVANWLSIIPLVEGINWIVLVQLLVWFGVATGLVAAAFGIYDYLRLPGKIQDDPSLTSHVTWMGAAWTIFFIAGFLRTVLTPGLLNPSPVIILIELAGIVILTKGGHAAANFVFSRFLYYREE